MTHLKQILIVAFSFFIFLNAASQWNNKHGFCGAPLKKWQIKTIVPQANFLQLKEKDTIVDVGAASGWFEGALACASPVEQLHFILLDIDSGCLTTEKVSNMTKYYSGLKGSAINYSYELVVNTDQSLELGNKKYSKLLVRNTIHEVSNQQLFAHQLSDATSVGGEVFIIEVLPTAKRKKHGGCHMPLLTFTQINDLFEKNGFLLREKKEQRLKKHVSLQMLRFVKQNSSS
jgi:hypothetical protein